MDLRGIAQCASAMTELLRHANFFAFLLASALIVPIALFAPLGMAVLAVITGCVFVCVAYSNEAWRNLPRLPIALILSACAWGLLSAAWSMDPMQSLKGAAKLMGSALFGLAGIAAVHSLDQRQQRRVIQTLFLSALAGAVLLTIESVTANGISALIAQMRDLTVTGRTEMKRGATTLVLVSGPIMIMLRNQGRKLLAVLPAVICLTITMEFDGLSSRAACLLYSVCGLAVWVFGQRTRSIISIAFVIAAFSLPVAISHLPPPQESFQAWKWMPNSAHHRLTIWSFTVSNALDKPIIGWGMDSSRWLPGSDIDVQVWRVDEQGHQIAGQLETQLPLHPHNALLQWWLELGIPGCLLLGGTVVWLLRSAARNAPLFMQAALVATIVAGLVVSMVSYGFWQSWWQSTMWIVASLTYLSFKQRNCTEYQNEQTR